MAESDKPQRGYVRVPDECRMELETLAARYDVPLRSLTRLVLCLGLEMVKVDERTARSVLARFQVAEAERQRLAARASVPQAEAASR